MNFAKPPLTIAQQVQKLTDRGMQGDSAQIADRLAAVGYYRLTAYWHPFRQPDRTFAPGTPFSTVWDRYVFDRHLRLLVMDAIERIEVTVRANLALQHSLASRPFAYVQQAASLPRLTPQDFRTFQDIVDREYQRSQETFVVHFKNTYGDQHANLPVWMATEIMTFGCVLTFFKGCSHDIQRAVARPFDVHHTVFQSWLLALNVIRNTCAHHGRLWNRVLGVKPRLPNTDPAWNQPAPITNDRVFGILTLCKWSLDRIAPQSHWPHRLRALIDRSPHIPIAEMGFPEQWQDGPIWATGAASEGGDHAE